MLAIRPRALFLSAMSLSVTSAATSLTTFEAWRPAALPSWRLSSTSRQTILVRWFFEAKPWAIMRTWALGLA